jgi:ABC-2 type transport system permease protein
MNTLPYYVRDSATMLRRNLRHMLRYPSMTVMLVAMPVIFLLVFVYVFGGTLGAGLGGSGLGGSGLGSAGSAASGLAASLGGAAGRAVYVNYVTPGIVFITFAAAATGTAVSVAMDMTEGIVARFRTMAISRASILTGHVIGSMIQTLLSIAVVVGVALLVGFRPAAGPAGWLAAVGILVLFVLAVTWMSVALGLNAKSAESASNAPMPLLILPFLGSGFVPTASMPAGLRWFAEYQPFTPVINATRGLLLGTPVGHSVVIAIAWGAGIALLSYLWAIKLFNRDPVR